MESPNDEIGELLIDMERGALISKLQLAPEEIDAALTQRGDPPFDDDWMREYRRIKAKKGSNKDAEPRIERLRELAYLQAFERWQSPDLSGCISDDFGLIGDALTLRDESVWIRTILEVYRDGHFPRSVTE